MDMPAVVAVSRMTLDKKAALTSGGGAWTTKSVGPVPEVILTDGPHGVRLQAQDGDQQDLSNSHPATCFPPAAGLASTFDVSLLHRVGVALGREARALNIGVLLGPGINIKRSPLGGRNFEYFSEDPHVSARLAGAFVTGVQSTGVEASLKHFAANNQETDRLRVSADVDERPLREIYLRAFEHVVRTARPGTVMCAYNKINGVLASQNRWLLTEVLRDEWGFDGLVISDWGAVDDRIAALQAGLDLEMPSSQGRTDAQLVNAVLDGRLAEELLDTSAARVATLAARCAALGPAEPVDLVSHHELALEAAEAAIVLLKNDGVLPLDRGVDSSRVAIIGELARTPRYQGAGSSLVNPTRLDNALDAIGEQLVGPVAFAAGYRLDGVEDSELHRAALELAATARVVVFFAGLPARHESEGFDRTTLDLPACQQHLLRALNAIGVPVVLVLANGGVVDIAEHIPSTAAILETWLLGQAGGTAMARTLFGLNNPSGKLAETIPLRLEDAPSYLNFPGENGRVRYGEGIFVGYRGYDALDRGVAFPFGHGLSYTRFDYGDASVHQTPTEVIVGLTVTNSGTRFGAEVVQIYATLNGSRVQRPPKELVGFSKVQLASGESARVQVPIDRRDLAYWDMPRGRWVVESGLYDLSIGSSSRDLRLTQSVDIVGDDDPAPISMESTIAEVLDNPDVANALRETFARNADYGALRLFEDPEPMLGSFPLTRISSFQEVSTSREEILRILDLHA